MKIRFAIILVAVLAVMLVLVACQSNNNEPDTPDVVAPEDNGTDTNESTETEEQVSEAPAIDISAPATIRMSWWGAPERHDAFIAAVRYFMTHYPHITVEYSPSGWDRYHEGLIVQLAGGDAPDLFSFGSGYRIQFGTGGFLINYDDYMEHFRFLQEVEHVIRTNAYMVGGRIIGVPAGINPSIMAYSRTLFDRANVRHPEDDMTWVEMFALWEEAVEALGPGFWAHTGWYWGQPAESLGKGQSNPGWFDFTNYETQPPTLNPNMDELRRAFSLVERHWDLRVMPRAQDDDVSFAVGNLLFDSVMNLNQAIASTEHELGFILAPRRWDENSPIGIGNPGPGLFWGICSNSDNHHYALHLLNFLQTNETAISYIGFHVGVPANPYSLEYLQGTFAPGSPEYITLDLFSRHISDVEVLTDRPAVAGMPEADRAMRAVFEEFVFEVIDLDTFLERVVPETQAALNEFFIPR